MCEWFQAGYFTMNLLVKRGCDEGFQPLGEVIKMWGRVPFSPGPSPPPLLVRNSELFRKGFHETLCHVLAISFVLQRFYNFNHIPEGF